MNYLWPGRLADSAKASERRGGRTTRSVCKQLCSTRARDEARNLVVPYNTYIHIIYIYIRKPSTAGGSFFSHSDVVVVVVVLLLLVDPFKRFLSLRSLHFQLSPRAGSPGKRGGAVQRRGSGCPLHGARAICATTVPYYIRRIIIINIYPRRRQLRPHLYYIDVPFRRRPECNAYIT